MPAADRAVPRHFEGTQDQPIAIPAPLAKAS